MSTLNVSNITDGTTTVGTSYVVNGSAKAWLNLNGTGTISIRDSFNTSSVSDNGTGDYTQNFSSSLANANFSAVGTAKQNATTSLDTSTGVMQLAYATSSFRFITYEVLTAARDAGYIGVTIQGDLA